MANEVPFDESGRTSDLFHDWEDPIDTSGDPPGHVHASPEHHNAQNDGWGYSAQQIMDAFSCSPSSDDVDSTSVMMTADTMPTASTTHTTDSDLVEQRPPLRRRPSADDGIAPSFSSINVQHKHANHSQQSMQMQGDADDWRGHSTQTMEVYHNNNSNHANQSSGIIMTDILEEYEHDLGAERAPPSRRRSSLNEVLDSLNGDKEVSIKYNDEERPLSTGEIQLLRSLLPGGGKRRHMKWAGGSSDSSSSGTSMSGANSLPSVDTATRDRTVKSKLSPDTFSFLIASPVRSSPFMVGLFILGLKGGIFSLIATNLVDTQNDGNPLNIPTSVPAPVIIGQFLALFIAVSTQGTYTVYSGVIHRESLVFDDATESNLIKFASFCSFR